MAFGALNGKTHSKNALNQLLSSLLAVCNQSTTTQGKIIPYRNLPSTEVPCTTAQRIRLGGLEEAGEAKSGIIDAEGGRSTPSWSKNASRFAWNTFARYKLGWKIKMSYYDFNPGDGNIIRCPYHSPKDILQYLMEKHPEAVIGGITSSVERALHLESFWAAYQHNEPDHMAFREHQHSLQSLIPVFYHGDEGRGKRRGNTVVVSLESPLGIFTEQQQQSRKPSVACGCNPPAGLKRKYHSMVHGLPDRLKTRLVSQRTNMRGHSFLQHWCMFMIPSVWHHTYPQLLLEMMDVISKDFKSLFYDGLTIGGKNFCVAVCGHKGDLKWFTKVASLQRSYEHKGRVRNLLCCHECMAGCGARPWEDMAEIPAWAPTRYSARPWDPNQPPALASIPFSVLSPEKQLRRDPFHTLKVGLFRDHIGSCIVYMVRCDLFGGIGDFDSKLQNAHGAFRLWASTMGKTPALRKFTRNFLTYPSFDKFPWMNCKGSDSVLCLQWPIIQCTAFQNDGNNGAHMEMLALMKETSKAAVAIFTFLNSHGLFYERDCAITHYAEITRFINGYILLASKVFNNGWKLWGLKPKIHLLKHAAFDLHESLTAGSPTFLNWNAWNCEQNEDFIGRCCRLSRRLDSRHICRRVLECTVLKSYLLHRRFNLNSG